MAGIFILQICLLEEVLSNRWMKRMGEEIRYKDLGLNGFSLSN